MEDYKIHFTNEPFMANVQGKGKEPILCTPVVYDEPYNFGLGVFYENGGGQVWGMVCPRNMIAAWRGTEVLRLLSTIENGTLCHSYYTGIRNPHKSDMESRVKPMIEKIGQDAYDKIMSMKVPETIIRAILDNQISGDFKPDTYPITDEVKAGTIEWRQEFEDAGIADPRKIEAEELEQKQTLKKYKSLLKLYAKAAGLSEDCLGMGYVEGALLTIAKKETENAYPKHVLVAVAGVVGSLAVTEFSMSIFPNHGSSSQSEYDKIIDNKKKDAIEYSAKWLTKNWKKPVFSFLNFFKKENEVFYTLEEAKSLLNKLLNEFFPVEQSAV